MHKNSFVIRYLVVITIILSVSIVSAEKQARVVDSYRIGIHPKNSLPKEYIENRQIGDYKLMLRVMIMKKYQADIETYMRQMKNALKNRELSYEERQEINKQLTYLKSVQIDAIGTHHIVVVIKDKQGNYPDDMDVTLDIYDPYIVRKPVKLIFQNKMRHYSGNMKFLKKGKYPLTITIKTKEGKKFKEKFDFEITEITFRPFGDRK